jgi:excisionase family DNA binding protein
MNPDLMTVGQAREYLGIGRAKMTKLIHEGVLATQPDPLDARIRLVKRADVEALAARSSKRAA